MSDLGKPVVDGLKTLISAALVGKTIYTNGVTDKDEDLTYPYLVLWGSAPHRSIANLAGNLNPATNLVQVVGIGRDPDEAITIIDRAAAAVVGKRLALEGWGPGFVREIPQNQPASENNDILVDGRPTYRAWTMFQLSAEPAPIGS